MLTRLIMELFRVQNIILCPASDVLCPSWRGLQLMGVFGLFKCYLTRLLLTSSNLTVRKKSESIKRRVTSYFKCSVRITLSIKILLVERQSRSSGKGGLFVLSYNFQPMNESHLTKIIDWLEIIVY